MTSTVAFDMAMVHRAFRNELHSIPDLVGAVGDGDGRRAATVNGHLHFVVAVLHHHHAAEDALVWPKLHARVPSRTGDIGRMESEHHAIAVAVDVATAAGTAWAKQVAAPATERLQTAVRDLIGRVDDHLDDEEREVVPLIEEHLTQTEWAAVIARGAAILLTHPKLGLVIAGFVLEGVAPDEQQRFLAGVPAPARLMWKLIGVRMYEGYRAKLYGPRVSPAV